ncbi:SH3 domain-containing protein [Acinetobacter modestus]|uniref:SH3 domain-containing protein n=1 Tax=Acinetobacter modestus TaxID=1776740 RepID=UPI003016D633
MSNKKLRELDFMSNKLENYYSRIFKNQNELNRIFRAQDEISKKIEKFIISDKFDYYSKFENKFSKLNKEYDLINHSDNLSKLFTLTNIWDEKINNTFNNAFKINEYFLNLEKNNSNILTLIDKREFIEFFLENHIDATENDNSQQDINLNLFGEMINHEIATQEIPLSVKKSIDFRKLALSIQYLLYTVFILYISHLDKFEDYMEAFVFYINNIECKGITISRINLRIGPSFDNEIIVAIPKGSALLVYEETSNGWVKVKVNINNIDFDGYVSQAYIKRLNQ